MTGRIEALGTRVRLSGPAEGELDLTDAVRPQWADWTARYRTATGPAAPGTLLDLGRELFGWLDAGGWARAWADAGGARRLEIAAEAQPTDDQRALLDLPWEALADARGHLAADGVQAFEVWRRVGPAGEQAEPRHRDLSLLFMAASPRGGGPELDYEAEEAAILAATERLPLALAVEESGCAEFLRDRLDGEEAFEAIHLSCHGTVLDAAAAQKRQAEVGPVLLLETPHGTRAFVSPGRLARVWGGTPPGLVFLSACRTAESPEGTAESFARTLARSVPAVLGWDGSVYDPDAIAFGEAFYRELAGRETPAFAAAAARRAVLERHLRDPQTGVHWHLARLWLGAGGGGPLCARGKEKRRLPEKGAGYKALLDSKRGQGPEVAGALTFVGRRREAQAVLAAFRADRAPGVLLLGMGNLGKSSLAARIANRQPQLETVVVYRHYDPLAVLERVGAALPPAVREDALEQWRERIAQRPEALADALEALLEGPFDDAPILLVVDDLEQVLEEPAPGRTLTPVNAANRWRVAIASVLAAFGRARGDSRLIFTSRYDFAAADGAGRDLAAALVRVPLTPFDPGQRAKQWRAGLEARLRGAGSQDDAEAQALQAAASAALADARLPGLRQRALQVANGNPGLQDILTRPLLAGEFDAVEAAIGAIEGFLERGKVPAEANKAFEFFRRMTFDRYRAALAPAETTMLRAASVFGEDVWPPDTDPSQFVRLDLGVVPIPVAAIDAVGAAAGVGDPAAARTRLAALGLLDAYTAGGSDAGSDGFAVNRFARPLVERLDPDERKALAAAALPALAAAWCDGEGDWPYEARGVEAARTALLAEATEAVQPAARAAFGHLYDRVGTAPAARAALALGEAALTHTSHAPDLVLVRRLAVAAGRLGEGERRAAILRHGLEAESGDSRARARLAVEEAKRLATVGDPEGALKLLRAAAETFERLGDVGSRAIAMRQIGDLLHERGMTDQALRIYREELLVSRQLGDARGRAIAMGRIADVLQARGEIDEALRIRREEQLPVYERLGDVRSRAVALGKIADVLHAREPDEALRIRREEELPVYERIGDARARADTMGKIADVLKARGEIEEALRIYREEQLPVYERLGDVRGRAVALGKIADVLRARGEIDEALRIFREEQLPVYERLGDVRSRADTMGKIADVLQARGEIEEALRIRREEQLPVYERLGDEHARAVTLQKIAKALLADGGLKRGPVQDMLMALSEAFDIFERLGSSQGVADTGVALCVVLDVIGARVGALVALTKARAAYARMGHAESLARCDTLRRQIEGSDEARGAGPAGRPCYREEQLPVYERLGDVRGRAVALGKFADVQARGELDEALRIRREEQLPVIDRLGDLRERAVTQSKIAGVLQARGETEEALRIYREEELPVYERLGDEHARAVTMGKIADVLRARGEIDEALRIFREEQLPVYERLGDVRSRADTMGKIADVLQARGEIEEALRIRREEQLPVYERLGDEHARAVTLQKIARALLADGGLERGPVQDMLMALSEAFDIFERLGSSEGVADTGVALCEVLDVIGARVGALVVLTKTRAAYARMGHSEGLAHCDTLRRQIEGRDG